MRHPNDGTLRRLLDEPAAVADTDRAHVTTCAACQAALTSARHDLETVRALLSPDVDVDVDAGWRRLAAGLDTPAGRAATVARARRWRIAWRSPVVAGIAAAALLTGATAAAATNWLPIFRTERVAPVTVSPADLVALPDLSAYGDVEFTERARVREVPDAAAARAVAGLPVPEVSAPPRGVTGGPKYYAGDRASAVFTFSAAKAARTAAAAGRPLPPPPAGLDGSHFRLTAGPGLAVVWASGSGAPALAVGRVVAPTADSSGIPFTTARDYLLSLPGLPESVAGQLRSFTGDGTTLPLLVKSGKETSSTADVNGAPAVVLSLRDGSMAGVFWVERGIVTAVAGSMPADEVLAVARGLRW
ncbi:hypothetical protein [Dactylosporangium sp. NPDC051541]|uniref:hypothetical protein n=1 Tax=Dactylosporangium sp. NPDC051541 TaxID=3363977 RepID=UPI0037A75D11